MALCNTCIGLFFLFCFFAYCSFKSYTVCKRQENGSHYLIKYSVSLWRSPLLVAMAPNTHYCHSWLIWLSDLFCHRGVKKPEHIHAEGAVISIFTYFFLQKFLKPIIKIIAGSFNLRQLINCCSFTDFSWGKTNKHNILSCSLDSSEQ